MCVYYIAISDNLYIYIYTYKKWGKVIGKATEAIASDEGYITISL